MYSQIKKNKKYDCTKRENGRRVAFVWVYLRDQSAQLLGFKNLSAVLHSHCSEELYNCLKTAQIQPHLNLLWLLSQSEECVALFLKWSASDTHTHAQAHTHRADLPGKPNRTSWQMCRGNNSPCHLFFGASPPNTPLSVLKPRTGWYKRTITGEAANNALSISPLGYWSMLSRWYRAILSV